MPPAAAAARHRTTSVCWLAFLRIRPGACSPYNALVLCTPVQLVTVDGITVVGERINPTGKKRFQQALREGDDGYPAGTGGEPQKLVLLCWM